MNQNGTEPPDPIRYPTIMVPGKGTFVVKFGHGAKYALYENLGLDEDRLFQQLQAAVPHKDPVTGQEIPGRVMMSFVWKILSACLWSQAHLAPLELAECFDAENAPTESDIVRIIVEAVSKRAGLVQNARLQEPAVTSPEPPAVLPN